MNSQMGLVVVGGWDSYSIDLISDSVMPVGDYVVIFYWSDMSIGSCFFSVRQKNGEYVIDNVEEYGTLDTRFLK